MDVVLISLAWLAAGVLWVTLAIAAADVATR